MSSAAARSATPACSAAWRSPSSAITPRTATRRRADTAAKQWSAAATDAGLALYASLMISAPVGLVPTAIRHGDSSARPRPSATASMLTPRTRATVAAPRALCALWRPAARSRTGARPHGVTITKEGRSAPSRVGAPARTSPALNP